MKFINCGIFCAVVCFISVFAMYAGESQTNFLAKRVKVSVIEDREGLLTVDPNNSEEQKEFVVRVKLHDQEELEQEARANSCSPSLSTDEVGCIAVSSLLGGFVCAATTPAWLLCLPTGSKLLAIALTQLGTGLGIMGVGAGYGCELGRRLAIQNPHQVTLELLEQTMMENG